MLARYTTRLQQCNGGERAKVPSLGWPFCFLLLDWFRRVNGVYAQPISSAFPARLQARNCSARHGCGPRRRVSGDTAVPALTASKASGTTPFRPPPLPPIWSEEAEGCVEEGRPPSADRSAPRTPCYYTRRRTRSVQEANIDQNYNC